ncbi:uncharacterized protein BdWA1_003537 [Babesia duncani]|nr:hypothetical protein BdWA1_003537 [Babesia duncani]
MRLTIPRDDIEDIFNSIGTFTRELGLEQLFDGTLLNQWSTVPKHRSWRRVWWRCIPNFSLPDDAPSTVLYITRTLEKLDALGNIRYDANFGIVAVGYLQRHNKCNCYWKFFYVSELGLWKTFCKAVEYFLLMVTLPPEISWDTKCMHWAVNKSHKGEQYRKSFSASKHGFFPGYAMAIKWFEALLFELRLASSELSDFESESDVGHDELIESLYLNAHATPVDICHNVADTHALAKRRKRILMHSIYERSKNLPHCLSNEGGPNSHFRDAAANTLLAALPASITIEALELNEEIFKPHFIPLLENKSPMEQSVMRDFVLHLTEFRDPFNKLMGQYCQVYQEMKMQLTHLLNLDYLSLEVCDDEIPMQDVVFHRNSDSWTCALYTAACLSCAPMPCQNYSSCIRYNKGHDAIAQVAKKLKPCSVRFTAHPFYKESPGSTNNRDTVDGCCIVAFSAAKFGYKGARALATEFRKRFLKIAHTDLIVNHGFNKIIYSIVAKELETFVSTKAFVVDDPQWRQSAKLISIQVPRRHQKDNDESPSESDSLEPDDLDDSEYSEPRQDSEDSSSWEGSTRSSEHAVSVEKSEEQNYKNTLEFITCSCKPTGPLVGPDGPIDLHEHLENKLPVARFVKLFGIHLLVNHLGTLCKSPITFCHEHSCWSTRWKDAMHQQRYIYHRVESHINAGRLTNLVEKLDMQWNEARTLLVQNQQKQTMQACKLFQSAFAALLSLQSIINEALLASFAMACRSIADAHQEIKVLQRIHKAFTTDSKQNVVSKDLGTKSLAFADSLLFCFGSLYDEGTPPLSDVEA